MMKFPNNSSLIDKSHKSIQIPHFAADSEPPQHPAMPLASPPPFPRQPGDQRHAVNGDDGGRHNLGPRERAAGPELGVNWYNVRPPSYKLVYKPQ